MWAWLRWAAEVRVEVDLSPPDLAALRTCHTSLRTCRTAYAPPSRRTSRLLLVALAATLSGLALQSLPPLPWLLARLPASPPPPRPRPRPRCRLATLTRWRADNRLRFAPLRPPRHPNASCAARDADAPSHCACFPSAALVAIRSRAGGGYLTTFPRGGEAFAIGRIGRMPLRRLLFELTPTALPPWVRLRHLESNTTLGAPPAAAREGAWMLLAGATEEGADWCVAPARGGGGGVLYARSTRGHVNARGGFGGALVLLRTHGNEGPHPAAATLPTAQLDLFRVRGAAVAADDEWWRCHVRVERERRAAEGEASRGEGGGGQLPGKPPPTLHVLTYATAANEMLCDCLLLALTSGVKLVVLGFGEQYLGNYQKLLGARLYVATLPPSDLVLFADAYDVLYVGNTSQMRERFLSLHLPRRRVLFMAEKGCWPDWDMAFGRTFCRDTYPKSPTPYRYLNSGSWIGYADAAHELLSDLEGFSPGLDDQHVVAHTFIGQPERFELDRHAVLFQSMQEETGLVTLTEGRAAVRNVLTNTEPLVLHFNGGSKPKFASFRDALLREKCLPSNATIQTSAGTRSFQQMCSRQKSRLPPCGEVQR